MSEICSIPTETCEEATKLRGEITHKEGSFTHSDKIRGDTCRELFFGSELLVRSCSGVNDQCLRIAHVGKVTCKTKLVDDGTSDASISLDTEAKYSTEGVRTKKLFGTFV